MVSETKLYGFSDLPPVIPLNEAEFSVGSGAIAKIEVTVTAEKFEELKTKFKLPHGLDFVTFPAQVIVRKG